ncbi:MAG TPA: LapA family protein [Thermodesulfobacteriota bacterium]|nr:LapA family protein [Thermodesulfobacteriota bacterium]
MKFAKIIIIALFFILALTLIIQNQEVFSTKFPLKLDLKVYQIGPYETSNIVLLVCAFLIGVFFAIAWGAFYAVSIRNQIKERDSKIKELQSQREDIQIHGYRETPKEETFNINK